VDHEEKKEVIRQQIMRSRYLAGQVIRYHAFPTLRKPTVAEHCWRVAGIYCEVFGLPRAEVLYYCLHHDSGELWAGDLPFMAKDRIPGLREAMNQAEQKGREELDIKLPELTEEELRHVKICDLLEMHEFGSHEYKMGNQFARPVAQDTLQAAFEIARDDDRPKIIEWRKPR
jgi:5'-deoxynucleotidase YfbR-like HD superfamily hydrolase